MSTPEAKPVVKEGQQTISEPGLQIEWESAIWESVPLQCMFIGKLSVYFKQGRR